MKYTTDIFKHKNWVSLKTKMGLFRVWYVSVTYVKKKKKNVLII